VKVSKAKTWKSKYFCLYVYLLKMSQNKTTIQRSPTFNEHRTLDWETDKDDESFQSLVSDLRIHISFKFHVTSFSIG
jgi:hypothetical protein